MKYTIVKIIDNQRQYFSRGGQFAVDMSKALSFAFPPVNYLAGLRHKSDDNIIAIGNINTDNEVFLG